MKTLIAFILSLSLPVMASAQKLDAKTYPGGVTSASVSGSIAANSAADCSTNCLLIQVSGWNSAAIQVSGTFVGTLTWSVSLDKTNFTPQRAFVYGSSAVTATSSTTGTGMWLVPTTGMAWLKVAGSSWTSGTANIIVQTGQTAAVNVNDASASVSGVGNAAASATGTAVPASADYTGINIGGNLFGLTGKSVGSEKAASVAIVDGTGAQITSFGGGTQYTNGSAQATPTGTTALGYDGANVRALSTDTTGHLSVVFSGTPSFNISQLGGSAPSATNPFPVRESDGTTALTYSNLDLDSGAGTANRIAVGVAGAASGGPVPITATGNSLNVNCTGGCTGGGGGTQFAEDSVHTTGDLGTMSLAVRKDTATALAGTDGDYAPLEVDANGRLHVQCGNCSGTGVSVNEDTASASGDPGTPAYTIRQDSPASTTSADGDYQPLKTDVNGLLWTNTELPAAVALADTTLNPTVPGVGSFNMCYNGTTWDRCKSATTTEVTHDGPLTPSSTVSTVMMGRASAAAPTDVTADNDAVLTWLLRSGAVVVNPSYGGTLAATGNGTATSGTPRVTIASDNTPFSVNAVQSGTWSLASNQSVNVSQINGVAPLMGAGNTGTGSPRVTIATDQAGLNGLGIYVEDAAETAGGNLSMAGSVRRDTLASSAGTAGDNATINTTAEGAVWTTPSATTNGGASVFNVASAATNNSTNIKASAGQIYGITLVNTTNTIYYLRLYNLTSAPTCSSATGYVTTIPVPASTSGAGITVSLPVGISFGTGIGYCITGGGTSTDNTNAAVGIFGMINYK